MKSIDDIIEEKNLPEPRLVTFMKTVRNKMNMARIISRPRTFEDIDSEQFAFMAYEFFKITLCDDYLETLPKRIDEWIKECEEYFNEFAGSWEYYARAKRIDLINEYGGDDGDYNDDGSIKKDVTLDELSSYSILNELVFNECRDIIQDTNLKHIIHFTSNIKADGMFDMREMMKCIAGHTVPSYHIDEEGNAVENTFADEEIHKAQRQIIADDVCDAFQYIMVAVVKMIEAVNEQKKTKLQDNNREFIQWFLDNCYAIKNMDLDDITLIFRKEDESK